jgi:hypothetical protein
MFQVKSQKSLEDGGQDAHPTKLIITQNLCVFVFHKKINLMEDAQINKYMDQTGELM